jgi:hypothetical protein
MSEVCKSWGSEKGCRYGTSCKYQHSGAGKLATKVDEACKAWKSERGCRRGDACLYKHEGATGKLGDEALAAKKAANAELRAKEQAERAAAKAAKAPKAAAKAAAPKAEKKDVVKVDEVCKAWTSENGCRWGNRCKYQHVGEGQIRRRVRRGAATKAAAAPAPQREKKPDSEKVCRFFKKPEGCKLGDECPFLHIKKE